MNPIVSTLVGALAALTAAGFARRARADEARWAAAGGAGVALAAGLLVVLWSLGAPTVAAMSGGLLGGPWLLADGITGTLVPAVSLAVLALHLGLPRHLSTADGHARLSAIHATTLLALVAGDVFAVVGAETAGLLLVLRAQPAGAGRRLLWLSAGLMVAGLVTCMADGTAGEALKGGASNLSLVLFGLAASVRLGLMPFATGMLDALDRRIDLAAILMAVPLGGVVLLARVVHPSLVEGGIPTAVQMGVMGVSLLAGLMALSQNRLGRTVGYTIAALHGLLVVGNLDASTTGFLGAEVLWAGTLLAETGLLLVLVLVSARVGEVDVSRHHGLHDEMPVLSVLGLVLALGAAGLPGSLDFVAEELLLSGHASHHLPGTLLLVGVIAAVGFNLMRVQFRVFYGPSRQPAVFGARPMFDVIRRERLALMLVVGALTAGGVLPTLLPLMGRGMG